MNLKLIKSIALNVPLRHLLLLLVSVLGTVNLCAAEAEQYYIEHMNCKQILVGDRWCRKHDVFTCNQTIHWTKGTQYMRVRSLVSQKVYHLTMAGFQEQRARTLQEFLVNTSSASTRGMGQQRHYSRVRHYLVDTLCFQAFDEPQSGVLTEAVWLRSDGQEVITPLRRTPDGTHYVVTRSILGRGTPPDSLQLDIRERSTQEDWVNRVYRHIPVICLPKKVK